MNTRLILEIGCNHQGSFDIAMKMIDYASMLGASAIKLQKRDIESFSEEYKNKKRNINNSFGKTYYEHRKVLELNIEQLESLMKYSHTKGLSFICSAFDEKSIHDLIEIDCQYIKLPSQLFSDENLKKVLLNIRKQKDINIIVSTGMHEENEIFKNDWLEYADIILHCISTYPCVLTNMNLNTLQKLKRLAKGRVGYSSHENEGYGIKYAVIAGAEYIERHFTLNKEWKGSDHGTVSSDPGEIKKIVADIEWAERMLGQERKCLLKERNVRKIYRGF